MNILSNSVDNFMSITIILILLFGVVFTIIFSAVQVNNWFLHTHTLFRSMFPGLLFIVHIYLQIHKESMYLVTFTSNLFNSSLHPEMSEWLPENIDMSDTIDSMADNAYVYGREWISSKVWSNVRCCFE